MTAPASPQDLHELARQIQEAVIALAQAQHCPVSERTRALSAIEQGARVQLQELGAQPLPPSLDQHFALLAEQLEDRAHRLALVLTDQAETLTGTMRDTGEDLLGRLRAERDRTLQLTHQNKVQLLDALRVQGEGLLGQLRSEGESWLTRLQDTGQHLLSALLPFRPLLETLPSAPRLPGDPNR